MLLPISKEFDHKYTHSIARFCNTYKDELTFDDFYEWYQKKDNSEEKKLNWLNHHWPLLAEFPPYDIKHIYGILRRFYPSFSSNAKLNSFINLFTKPDDIKVVKINAINQDVFNDNVKFTVLNVGMGGGKTAQTIDCLTKHNTFIWITPNQALSFNTHSRFATSENKNNELLQLHNRYIKEQNEYIKLLENTLTKPEEISKSPRATIEEYQRELIRAKDNIRNACSYNFKY